ncbi:serine threonine- kinase A-Raf-like [Paramuricea clavata]|uniref:Serine threonine- kinase A-Raf-like n=2 Tax=Paramuricea clavata TaxID=317549 RepID=A0A6S7I247_PARCT|nr:serine threonine- kinase A-Raf-like [Paramuricea clavata]
MAPEIIQMKKGSNPYSNMSDVYAYGNVLYELTSRTLPYADFEQDYQIMYKVGCEKLTVDLTKIRSDTPESLKKLLKDCIDYERDKRPEFKKILADLDAIIQSLPRIHRSMSEPILINLTEDDIILSIFHSRGSNAED